MPDRSTPARPPSVSWTDLARDFGISKETKGVLVERVDPDSDAAEAGLERGDVILEVNKHAVATVEQMQRYLNEGTNGSTLLFVSRDGRTRYVVISSK